MSGLSQVEMSGSGYGRGRHEDGPGHDEPTPALEVGAAGWGLKPAFRRELGLGTILPPGKVDCRTGHKKWGTASARASRDAV